MTNKLIPIIAGIVLNSCNSGSNTTPAEVNTKNSATTECYNSISDKDTIILSMTIRDGSVTGDLYYNLMEKDKNTGSIEGKMIGDTIVADYTFMSEGMQSIREVVFLKKGNTLTQGFGAIEDINGKTVFKDRSALVFNDANQLTKVDCAK